MNNDSKPKGQKRNNQPGRPGYLKDARIERAGEKIGGGFFVFRRGKKSGRVRAPEWPFEHPTLEAAETERNRLCDKFPGEWFVVFRGVSASRTDRVIDDSRQPAMEKL